jgi:hypothetical protein
MKQKIASVLIGVAALVLVQLLAGWKPASYIGNRAFAVGSVACSADGKTVYAADLDAIYKSEDGGNTWLTIKKGAPIKDY